jgi:hypothetical protein
MPVHDWTRAEAGDFHHFHQTWITGLAAALNGGRLPPGFLALAERVTGRPIPDVVTLQARPPKGGAGSGSPRPRHPRPGWFRSSSASTTRSGPTAW